MRRTHHVGKITAPGRVQPTRQTKGVVLYFIETRTGHYAADLRLLAEGHDVGQHIKVFARPIPAGWAHAEMYFIKDEENVDFDDIVHECFQPFPAKMIIAYCAVYSSHA